MGQIQNVLKYFFASILPRVLIASTFISWQLREHGLGVIGCSLAYYVLFCVVNRYLTKKAASVWISLLLSIRTIVFLNFVITLFVYSSIGALWWVYLIAFTILVTCFELVYLLLCWLYKTAFDVEKHNGNLE